MRDIRSYFLFRWALKGSKAGPPAKYEPNMLRFGILLKIAVTLLVLGLDIFGIGTATDRASMDAFRKIASHFYPADARDDIIVITFKDSDLPLIEDWDFNLFAEESEMQDRPFSTAWPLTAYERRRFFELVSEGRPAAIFIDLYMPSARGDAATDVAALAASLGAIARGDDDRFPVPVFLAELPANQKPAPEQEAAYPGVLPLIRGVTDHPVKLVMAGWDGDSTAYPAWVSPAEGDMLPAVDKGSPGALPSPAYALYEAQSGAKAEDASDMPPMTLMWGQKAPSPLTGDGTSTCPEPSLTRTLANAVASPRDSSSSWYQLTPCLYHSELSARQVINLAQNNELWKVLEDKLVLIGAVITGIDDSHLSPVHGNVPGVHRHAMALDNLITYDNRYFRSPPVLFESLFGLPLPTSLTVIELIEALLVALAFGWGARLLEFSKGGVGPALKVRAIAFVGFSGLLLALLAIMTIGLHWVPVNWVALMVLALLSFFEPFDGCRTCFEGLSVQGQQFAIWLAALTIIVLLLWL